MDRTESLLSGIDLDREVGLEIGPLAYPLVRKEEGRTIFYADYASQEALRAASGHNQLMDLNAIPEIDYIISPLPLELDRKFDYIVASHVIEHVPDILGFLLTVLGWLSEPFGRLVLAIPDKRHCFDYLRPTSTAGQVLEAYYEHRTRPSFASIYDGFRLAIDFDLDRSWREDPYRGSLDPSFNKAMGLDLAREAFEKGTYRDCHCWVFTYTSFLALIAEINLQQIASIEVLSHSAPVHGANEFHVILRRGSPFKPDAGSSSD